MPRVSVPASDDPLIHVWGRLAPELSGPAAAYSSAVYAHSHLPLREFEAARITVAQINGCALCLDWRSATDVPSRAAEAATVDVSEDFYRAVLDGTGEGLSERERCAAEFARLYCEDHTSLDDAFWARLRAAFSDEELVDLALSVGSWLALGRFNQVFDIDGGCRVPAPPSSAT